MTPEEAQALEPGTTSGPWEWKDNCDKRLGGRDYDSLGNDTHHALVTQDCEDYSSWVIASDEDKALIAAAPDMRATIAALRWEYAVEDLNGDFLNLNDDAYSDVETLWTWNRAVAEETHAAEQGSTLVRRLAGPVEEVSK